MVRSAQRQPGWVETALAATDEPVYLVDFRARDVASFTRAVADGEGPPDGAARRLLVEEPIRERLRDDFLIGSRLAELVDADAAAVRAATDHLDDRAVVGEDDAWLLLTVGDDVSAIPASDGDLVEGLRRKYGERWSAAQEIDLRSPPRDRVTAAVAEEITEEAAADLTAAVDGAERLRWGEKPDPTDLLLLVGARADAQFQAVTAAAERVSLSSRSSCSRAKQDLENAGLLRTERIPQGIGRPRQRLVPGREWVAEAAPEELVRTAREQL